MRLTGLVDQFETLRLRAISSSGDVADRDGLPTVAFWLAPRVRGDQRPAHRAQSLAEPLDQRRTLLGDAASSGRVTPGPGRGDRPRPRQPRHRRAADLLRRAEAHLIDQAALVPPVSCGSSARRFSRSSAPTPTTTRSAPTSGGASRLKTYLEAFASPRQQPPDRPGVRVPHERRMGQAFYDLLERLDPDTLPEHGGAATRVVVTIPSATSPTDSASVPSPTAASASTGGRNAQRTESFRFGAGAGTPTITAMDVLAWLLDGDPAIRWQVLRDLVDAPDGQVAAERARVETEGWGARLLSLRDPDGQWDGGACFPRRIADSWRAGIQPDFSHGQPWTATLPTLMLLHDLGLDPRSPAARETIALVAANCRWEHDDQAFFDGEVEACINGRTLSIGSYFGADVDGLVTALLAEQLEDGGWNCEVEMGATVSSFDSTLCVLEGLLEYELSGGPLAVAAARRRGEEYLLERQLFRRRSTGEVPAERWLQFSWPPRWHYDVLRALDHFRRTGEAPDDRMAAAVQLVRDKQQSDGTWPLENTHPGETQFPFEDGDGHPSRWNTLRALRVLGWYDQRR